jgi:hypothetical protein
VQAYAPLLIAGFGIFYWQLAHYLNIRAETTAGKPGTSETPRDHLMGIGILVLLSPLAALFWVSGSPVAVFAACTLWPLVAMLILGWWRGRQSVSATLIIVANGSIVAILASLDRLEALRLCRDIAVTAEPSTRIEALSYCAEMARFWLGTWVTVSIAFMTTFAAALALGYIIKPEDFGWSALPEQRQILAILYGVAAIWLMSLGYFGLGEPAIRWVTELTRLQLVAPPPT